MNEFEKGERLLIYGSIERLQCAFKRVCVLLNLTRLMSHSLTYQLTHTRCCPQLSSYNNKNLTCTTSERVFRYLSEAILLKVKKTFCIINALLLL